jgi:hypothetical protein
LEIPRRSKTIAVATADPTLGVGAWFPTLAKRSEVFTLRMY